MLVSLARECSGTCPDGTNALSLVSLLRPVARWPTLGERLLAGPCDDSLRHTLQNALWNLELESLQSLQPFQFTSDILWSEQRTRNTWLLLLALGVG